MPDGPGEPGGTRHVLVVEDVDDDFESLLRAVGRTRPDLVLDRAVGSADACRHLVGAGPRPALVLLDLHLPDGDGREVLRRVRARSDLADMPVVVLTSSTNPRDVEECYDLGADGYVFKPVTYALFASTMRGTVDYWVPPATAG